MLLQVAEDGDLKLVDASDAWRHNTPLYCAIILSLVIAAMCSLLVVAMLVYTGLSMLKKINIELQACFPGTLLWPLTGYTSCTLWLGQCVYLCTAAAWPSICWLVQMLSACLMCSI